MNSFGTLFRVSIIGESHGSGVGIILDGCPPGIVLDASVFEKDISRRKGGSKGTTPRMEEDLPQLLTGIFEGKTTGAPLTIWFENRNIRSDDYETFKKIPRPGHADWVAAKKFSGMNDFRGGGHFSGRLTVCLVAAGVVAKKILSNTSIEARLIEAGGDKDIEKALEKAVGLKDSIGGIVECTVQGLPVGLGEPFFNAAESLIAHAVFSIPAVRGIEFGTGFAAAAMTGSAHNDAILDESGKTATNHAGGINGGLTNGNPLVFRVAFKPTSSTPQSQISLNIETNQPEAFTVKGRHDLCIALRAPVVVEAAAAIVLADLWMISKK